MAQQESMIKLKGKIGDLTFFKTKNGYQARKKGGVTADRIKNDPAYQRTRENNKEFAEVCVVSKKVRDVLRGMTLLIHDPKLALRLNSRVFRMMKADVVSLRGERKVTSGSFSLLKDFNFNEAAQLNNTIYIAMAPGINRTTGEVTLTIPEILPEPHLSKPKGATHFRITTGAALISLNEEVESSILVMGDTAYQNLSIVSVAPQVITLALPPDSLSPIIQIIGISFYQEMNSMFYPMNNGGYNAMSVVAIDTP